MQEIIIGPNQAGQRLDKFLHKYLPNAGSSFLYKMLRKKNITLNGKKAEGKSIIMIVNSSLDEIQIELCLDRFFVTRLEDAFSGQPLDYDHKLSLNLEPLSYRVLVPERKNDLCTKIQSI